MCSRISFQGKQFNQYWIIFSSFPGYLMCTCKCAWTYILGDADTWEKSLNCGRHWFGLWLATEQGMNNDLNSNVGSALIETVSAGDPSHTASEIGRTPHLVAVTWKIQKAMLFYHLVTSNVCLRHRWTFHCGLNAVNGEKTHQWTSCGTWLWALSDGQNSAGWWLKCPCLISI